MTVQTTYGAPNTYREGQIVDAYPDGLDSYVVEGTTAIKAGILALQGTHDRQLLPMAALPAADPNGIKLAFASNVLDQEYVADGAGTDLDGVTGEALIIPARSVTFTADADVGWGSALGFQRVAVYGVDAAGEAIHDDMFIPNGGGVTLHTDHAFAFVTSVRVSPALAGTGTGQIGLSNDVVEVGPLTHPGVPVYEPMVEPESAVAGGGEFGQYDQVAVMRKGRFAAVSEHVIDSMREDVYVRVLAAGADVRGQFTGRRGAGTPATYARVRKAHWIETVAADGLAGIQIDW